MENYYKKNWLKNINRVHPPRSEQEVNNKLRLHRAERLYPFPSEFFEQFLKNINQGDIRYYPDVHQLKDRLSEKFNIHSRNIFLNNGSSENIRVFYDAFALQNKEVIITNPCYPMHKIYAELHNSNIKNVNYKENLTIDYQDIINSITNNTCCIVLANPNSPIGDIIEKENIEKIISEACDKSIPILIDEAYIEYSQQKSCIDLLNKYSNLVISRTFSKAYGCAGLRIGYLLGSDNMMEVIQKFIPTYEISSLSVKFGCLLLDNEDVIENYINLIKDEKNKLEALFNKYNIEYILNHINTIHIRPKNINIIKEYFDKEELFYRTRKLPYSDNEWLAIVLYPKVSESYIMKLIIESHLKQ